MQEKKEAKHQRKAIGTWKKGKEYKKRGQTWDCTKCTKYVYQEERPDFPCPNCNQHHQGEEQHPSKTEATVDAFDEARGAEVEVGEDVEHPDMTVDRDDPIFA